MKASYVQVLVTAGLIFAIAFSTGFTSGTYYGSNKELRKEVTQLRKVVP